MDSQGKLNNFHKLFEKRLELRKELKERAGKSWLELRKEKTEENIYFEDIAEAIKKGGVSDLKDLEKVFEEKEYLIEELRRLDEAAKEFSVKDQNVRVKVKEEFEKSLEEREWQGKLSEVSLEFRVLEDKEKSLDKVTFDIIKEKRGGITESDRARLSKIALIKEAINDRENILKTSLETSSLARAYELRKHQEGLKSGFTETLSRKEYMQWVETKWQNGKAVLLEGPTGTGKTELLIHLTKKLYDEGPEVVRSSERTGPSEIFGKSLLKEEKGATVTYFQPGRFTSAIDRGVPIVFDEFNQLPTNQRFQLKELYNRRPGDEVIIQEDTGRPHKIKEGFGFSATANIKGGKYKERFELDPAESRVFDMKHIDFMPKEELYDLSLAKLMDKKSGVPISKESALTTLKHLSDSAEEIQNAFDKVISHHYGMTSAKGGKPALEKAVLDPGLVLSMLGGYEVAHARGLSLEKHLDSELFDFTTKGDYPERDRELLIRILVSKGFFKDTEAKKFGLANLTETNLKPLRGAVKKVEEKKPEEKYLSLREVAELDPYEVRKKNIEAIGEEFFKKVPKREKKATSETLEIFPNLEEQYESQLAILKKVGILETLSSGQEGIVGINGQEYPVPTLEEIASRIEFKKELLEGKAEQGFVKLLLVPFAAMLDILREKYKQVILDHYNAGKILDKKGKPTNKSTKLLATKEKPTDPDEPLELDLNQPLWHWDKYENADQNRELVYFPKQFTTENHGGKTKQELLSDPENPWQVVFVEDLPNLPAEGSGKTKSDRKQIEANKTPSEYLQILQTDPVYEGEEGLTPEADLIYAISHLEETNQVINDLQGKGKASYQLSSWFSSAGVVPGSRWFRDSRRADLGWGDPGDRVSSSGTRASVRV